MNLRIGEIVKACGGKLVLNPEEKPGGTLEVFSDTLVDSVVLDSRKVTPGGVFVATVGEHVDGHRFIPQVFEAGAVLAVTEKTPQQVEEECGVPASGWGSYVLVENSFQALKAIAEAYRLKLQIPIVGITGSVGKTSTKEFIAGVLGEKFCVLKTEGNFNNEVGVPLTLLRIRKEHEAAVVEMGISDFGEMHRLSKMVRPNICVITNIGQCHLEKLKTRDGILQAKTEIFDYMDEDGAICLNGEDDKLRTVTEAIRGKCLESGGKVGRPHFFGLGNFPNEEVYATHVENKGLWGSDADLCFEEESLSVHIPLPGAHMVMNAAAADCVAKILGVSDTQIAAGLEKLQPVGGRNHLIRLERYTVIDDCYNANPVSMRAAIDLLAMADTYRVAILGDMFELGEDSGRMHGEVGAYAVQSGIEKILCVGENARDMYAQAKASGRAEYFADRDALLEAIASKGEILLPRGCTILVKASHGMEFAKVVQYLEEIVAP